MVWVMALVAVSAFADLNPIQQSTRAELLASGFKPDLKEIAKHTLGTAGHPVRVAGMSGVNAYAALLACPNGGQAFAQRDQSTGMGPFGFMVDRYDIGCLAQGITEFYAVHMDIYHPDVSDEKVDLAPFATGVSHHLRALAAGCLRGVTEGLAESEREAKQGVIEQFCACIALDAADENWGKVIEPRRAGEMMMDSIQSGRCKPPG